MVPRWFQQVLILGLVGIFCTSLGFAHNDNQPPKILRTIPKNGAEGISPRVTIHAFIVDQGWIYSGVDPNTVKMRVNGEYVQVTVYNLYVGVWVSFQHDDDFEQGVVEVIVEACDYARNCMAPHSFTFLTGNGAADDTPPWAFAAYPEDGAVEVAIDTEISVHLTDANEQLRPQDYSDVDVNSIRLYLGDAELEYTVERVESYWVVTALLTEDLACDAELAVTVEACDLAGNCMIPYTWHFATVSQDTEPPTLTLTIPDNEATEIPTTAILLAVLTDQGSGVDPNSIVMHVDGQLVTNVSIVSTESSCRVWYNPWPPLPSSQPIDVSLYVCDYQNNCHFVWWTFTTSAEIAPPEPVLPHDKAWLNYTTEAGKVTFSWTNRNLATDFRIRIYFEDISIPSIIDYRPADYLTGFGLVSVDYPLSEAMWNVLSTMGTIYWEVAQLDEAGLEVSRYSAPSQFTIARSDCLTLISPQDFSTIPSNNAPRFKWVQDANAASYVIGFAQIGHYGTFFENTFYAALPNLVTELPLTSDTWVLLPDGDYLWTVCPVYRDSTYGNFIMFHFKKISPL